MVRWEAHDICITLEETPILHRTVYFEVNCLNINKYLNNVYEKQKLVI